MKGSFFDHKGLLSLIGKNFLNSHYYTDVNEI